MRRNHMPVALMFGWWLLGQVSLTRREVFNLIEQCLFALRVTEGDKP